MEQEELVLLLVPVGANALEDARSVVEGVRHQTQLYIVVAGELALIEDPDVWMFRLLRRGLLFCFHTHVD